MTRLDSRELVGRCFILEVFFVLLVSAQMEAPRGRYSSAVEEDIMFRPCHENDPVIHL